MLLRMIVVAEEVNFIPDFSAILGQANGFKESTYAPSGPKVDAPLDWPASAPSPPPASTPRSFPPGPAGAGPRRALPAGWPGWEAPLGPAAVHLHLRPRLLGQLPAQVEPARLGLLEPSHGQPDHVGGRQALIPGRPGRSPGPSVLLIGQVDRDPLVFRRLDVLTFRRRSASRGRRRRQLGPGRPGPALAEVRACRSTTLPLWSQGGPGNRDRGAVARRTQFEVAV